MTDAFKAVKVSDHVWWVGAIDWAVRDFHGYETNRGSTYNAYLVKSADKTVLVDTVKKQFFKEMFSRISSVTDPQDIDFIISNHSEMDHSGCLPETIEAVKPDKVYASVMGQKALEEHFHLDGAITAVKDGSTLSLGDMNLTFIETRMIHWPDSMMTYLDKDQLLFSQDGFGMHLATNERFADQLPEDVLDYEAAKYYANILLPFSPLIAKAIEKIKASGLKIGIIAPDHGPIWRKDPLRIVGKYAGWTQMKPTNKTVIAYDTMWGSTDMMARAIGEGAGAEGGDVKLLPLRGTHRSEVATQILDAGAFVAGSPTINNQMFPTVADTLTYVRGLKRMNMVGGAFGSYGWSGEAVKQIEDILMSMKVELVQEGLKAKYVPNDEDLKACRAFGAAVASKLKGLK
jgi:flavorubredoxin